MIDKEFIRGRNSILMLLVIVFYCFQIIINIFIEGVASIFPPAFLFILLCAILLVMCYKKINPKLTMYVLVCFMYIYFCFLLMDSPYLVNYLFMWLALPLSAIYLNYLVIIIAGIASTMLTFYAYFNFRNEIFPNVVIGDFIYLVMFGLFITTFLFMFIRKVRDTNTKLQQLAFHDPLTGVANRLLLKERFKLLKQTKINSIAILFIDMNDFKKVNDTYGHEIGDRLLEQSVLKLKTILRETDLLCRLGGDEFVVLCSNIDDSALKMTSKQIEFALEKPIVINQQVINVSASIGWFCTSDVSHVQLEQMIKEADRAMYKHKNK